MDLFVKIVNSSNLLTIFAKCSILDVWQDAEYTSEKNIDIKMDRFVKIVNSSNLLTIFAKCSFLDVWQAAEYAFEKDIDIALDFKWNFDDNLKLTKEKQNSKNK